MHKGRDITWQTKFSLFSLVPAFFCWERSKIWFSMLSTMMVLGAMKKVDFYGLCTNASKLPFVVAEASFRCSCLSWFSIPHQLSFLLSLSLYIYLSIYLSIYLFIYLSLSLTYKIKSKKSKPSRELYFDKHDPKKGTFS